MKIIGSYRNDLECISQLARERGMSEDEFLSECRDAFANCKFEAMQPDRISCGGCGHLFLTRDGTVPDHWCIAVRFATYPKE